MSESSTFFRTITLSNNSTAVVADLSMVNKLQPAGKFRNIPITDELLAGLPWQIWGDNNLLPQEMLADIRRTGILTSIIDGKARFATCQGMVPVITAIDAASGQRVIKEYLDDEEIKNWLEDNDSFNLVFGWIKDYVAFGRCIARLLLNKKKDRIAAIKRGDVVQHRMAKMDRTGYIRRIYFSREWAKVYGVDSNKYFSKPLLNNLLTYDELKERSISGTDYEYVMVASHPGWDEDYYPIPAWMSALKWIRIIQSIPDMKNALYQNVIRAKFKITIYEKFWSANYGDKYNKASEAEKEKIRQSFYDEIDEFLVGVENAGKAIFVGGYQSRDGKMYSHIDIEHIPDTTKQGEYLPDSAAGNSEVSFAMLWNNALTGGNQKNGLYQENQGGSNVREATAMQVIVHEVERMQVQKFMNVVKRFNKWDKKYPGLEFVIPATILTTLDTGGSTKGVMTGGNVKDANGNVK